MRKRLCGVKGKWMLTERRAIEEAGRRRTKSMDIHAYPCRFCGRWHIGKEFNESRELTTLPVLGAVVIKHFKED